MLSPVAGSPARGPDVERRSPELWASKASGARAQELQGLGERRLHSWRAPLRFHEHWDPGKAVTPQESGPDISEAVEGLLGRQGQLLLTVGQGHQWQRLPGACSVQCWGAPGQTACRVGTQTRLSATGCPESSRAHSSRTHTDMAVPTEGHTSLPPEWAGASLSHREACQSPWTSLTHRDRHRSESQAPAALETETANPGR